jgi:hypothetical protein
MMAQDVASETLPERRDRQFDYQSPDDVCNETLDGPSWTWLGFARRPDEGGRNPVEFGAR